MEPWIQKGERADKASERQGIRAGRVGRRSLVYQVLWGKKSKELSLARAKGAVG